MGAQALDVWSRITGRASEITVPRVKKFCMHTEYPMDKLRALGFRQKYTLEQGIDKTVQWYLNREERVSHNMKHHTETKEEFI